MQNRRKFLQLCAALGIISMLPQRIFANIKEKTMQLRQKAREIYEELLGGAKKDALFASDKEFLLITLTLLLEKALQKQNCLKKSIF